MSTLELNGKIAFLSDPNCNVTSAPTQPQIAESGQLYAGTTKTSPDPQYISNVLYTSSQLFSMRRLPTEIWEIILDLAIDASVEPIGHCNTLTSPLIIAYLRSKDIRAPLDHSYVDLRLVCRLFKDLLGLPPHLVITDSGDVPPRKVRVLHIRDDNVSLSWLEILVNDQRRHPYIITLDLACLLTKSADQPRSFDAFCKASNALPSLRNLTLRLKKPSISGDPHDPIWSRINSAFPRLACLAVMKADISHGHILLPDSEPAIFESLEILELGIGIPQDGFLAPTLRHASVGVWPLFSGLGLKDFPLLESMLVRNIPDRYIMFLESHSHLRLFGIPRSKVDAVLSLWTRSIEVRRPPRFPSLSHLWIYAESSDDTYDLSGTIDRIPKCIPTVTRITVDLSSIHTEHRIRFAQKLDTCAAIRSGLLRARNGVNGDAQIILETPVVALQ